MKKTPDTNSYTQHTHIYTYFKTQTQKYNFIQSNKTSIYKIVLIQITYNFCNKQTTLELVYGKVLKICLVYAFVFVMTPQSMEIKVFKYKVE